MISIDCSNGTLLANGVCNDETNYAECNFDGGDCCGSCINTDYCTNCSCIANYTGNEVSNPLLGNGYCNDVYDTAECNFDGGDCCGQCEIIFITLESNAKGAQASKEGIYYNSSIVNGKPSWTSISQAIWYDQQYNDWNIGSLDDIGSSTSGIYSDDGNLCPFHLPSEMWKYSNNGWTSAGVGEINVACLNGNLSKYKQFTNDSIIAKSIIFICNLQLLKC